VEAIVVASLTDWSDGGGTARLPRPGLSVSLLRGSLSWVAHEARRGGEPLGAPAGSLGSMAAHRNRGRIGLDRPCLELPDRLPPGLGTAPLRIVGTGEFTFLPFILAEQLEQAGLDVVVQATSRSPARIGGAIGRALSFADNYRTAFPITSTMPIPTPVGRAGSATRRRRGASIPCWSMRWARSWSGGRHDARRSRSSISTTPCSRPAANARPVSRTRR
jgi:hypothetical protein